MTLRAVGNNGVNVSIRDTVQKELLELTAIFFGATVDRGRRRHFRKDAVVVVNRVTIAKRSGEIDAFGGGDIPLIAVFRRS